MTTKLTFSGIYFILFCLFLSCSDDLSSPNSGKQVIKNIPVRLTINNPYGYVMPINTKSQTANECAISEIEVLVFEGSLYKYRTQGNIVSSTATSTTFDALLWSSDSTVKLYIIANANPTIVDNEPAINSREEDIKNAIIGNFTTAGITQYFPMFGEYTFTSGLSLNTTITTSINMLRTVARIDVLNETHNFEIATIQAFRANNQIQIIPDDLTDPENPSVTAPSVPATATATIQTPQLTVTGNTSLSQLYLPEAAASDAQSGTQNATCVIVGGYYNQSTDITYYRIDFNSGDAEYPIGQILRNHRYVFNLTEVNGPGQSTPEEAANRASTNITIVVRDWDENTTNMIFDGTNYFGVSSRKVMLNWVNTSSATIKVNTNLTGYTLQWVDANGNPAGGAPDTQIQNTLFSATVSSNLTQIDITALTSNSSNSTQTQYMMIYAGNWKMLIEIDQISTPDYSNTIVSILSISTSYGSLGSSDPVMSIGISDGFRALLNNPANFSPTGVVKIRGIVLNYLNPTLISTSFTASTCRAIMEQYDILNVTYGSNPDITMSGIIMDWLNYKPNRILFIARDNSVTNTNLINSLGGGAAMWGGNGSYGTYNFVIMPNNPANDYFTNSGPFGPVNYASNANFYIADGTWYGISSSHSYASNVIPLVQFNTGTYYIIAVDPNLRIVYIGDSSLYQTVGGLPTTGITTNNSRATLIANIYAWVINKVILPGKTP